MFLIEISHPADALTDDDRSTIAEAVTGLISGGGEAEAPEATMRRARRMTHVAFRGLHGWHTGDGPVGPRTPPPMIATITIAAAWQEEAGGYMIGAVRSAIRRFDRRHGWSRPGGDLWINVIGIPDGSIGLDGKAVGSDSVLAFVTEEFRALQEAGQVGDVPEGKLLDPVCGMLVTPGKGAITLERDGVTVGFCAESCRASYAREHGLTVPAS